MCTVGVRSGFYSAPAGLPWPQHAEQQALRYRHGSAPGRHCPGATPTPAAPTPAQPLRSGVSEAGRPVRGGPGAGGRAGRAPAAPGGREELGRTGLHCYGWILLHRKRTGVAARRARQRRAMPSPSVSQPACDRPLCVVCAEPAQVRAPYSCPGLLPFFQAVIIFSSEVSSTK